MTSAPAVDDASIADSAEGRQAVRDASPYVGLVPYDEDDAPFFFGRSTEAAIVGMNLRTSRLTILYGPSGVGKSSLLMAGAVHGLREQARSAGENPFAVSVFRSWREDPVRGVQEAARTALQELASTEPLARPAETLAETLRAWTGATGRLLVVFDQFEEYFQYHPDEGNEQQLTGFAAEFARIVNDPTLPVHVLLSIREDAWAKLDLFEGHVPSLFSNYLRVDHLDLGAAREAIEGPIEVWNRTHSDGAAPFAIEPALVEAVLAAAAGGGLTLTAGGESPDAPVAGDRVEAPFLQLVLDRLWRDTVAAGERTLTRARLEELGGAARIVENHLLDALGRLGPAEQDAASDCFRFLVSRSRTKIAHPVSDLAEWTQRSESELTSVLDKLCTGESGRILRPVAPAEQGGSTSYELFHDILAEPILDWRRGYEQERARRIALRRFLRIGGGLLLLVAVFAALGVWALLQRSDARRATASATSLALASAASDQLATHPDVSLLLALDAYRAHPSPQATSAMIAALEAARRSGASAILRQSGPVSSLAVSPDGHTLAVADLSGTVQLWDLRTHTRLGRALHAGTNRISSVAFGPAGRELVTGTETGTVRVWDVRGRTELGQPLHGHVDLGTAREAQFSDPTLVAFAGDGRTLAAITDDSGVRLRDARTHTLLARPVRAEPDVALDLLAAAFNSDGSMLATVEYGGTVRIWNTGSNKRVGQWRAGREDSISSVAVSRDGRTVAVGDATGAIQLWKVGSRKRFGSLLQGQTGRIERLAFSPDGRTLASAAGDRTVRLWDVSTQTALPGGPLVGHTARVTDLAFSPDGRTLTAGGFDRTVRVWPVQARTPLGRRLRGAVGKSDFSNIVEFSPDGRTLAGASSDGSVRLWQGAKLRRSLSAARKPPRPNCVITARSVSCVGPAESALPEGARLPAAISFAGGGGTLATADDKAVRLWDLQTYRQRGQPLRVGKPLAVAFSPDSRTLVTAGNRVDLWNLSPRARIGPLHGHPGGVFAAAFSPDGRLLVTAGADKAVRLWDVRTRTEIGKALRGHKRPISSVAFSPDGRLLATGSTDRTVRVWNVERHVQLGQPLQGHTNGVSSVAFSPDGRMLVTGSTDKTVRLWDGRTHTQLGQPLRASSAVWNVAFNPDGRVLASTGDDGSVRLWEGILWHDRADLGRLVCGLVGGNLTKAEWDVLAQGLAYRTSCPTG